MKSVASDVVCCHWISPIDPDAIVSFLVTFSQIACNNVAPDGEVTLAVIVLASGEPVNITATISLVSEKQVPIETCAL